MGAGTSVTNKFIEDDAAFEEWVGNRPFLILVNAEVNPRPMVHDLPREIVDQLNGRRPDFLVASFDELNRIGIVLSHDQVAKFRNGVPVIMAIGRVDHREALKRGRRRKEELERQVQDALAVQTYLSIERLCAWQQARDGRRLNVTLPELRDRVIEDLSNEAWVEDRNVDQIATDEDRKAFFRTQADAGSRLIATWYSWARRPDDLSRVARQVVRTSAQEMDQTLIAESIRRERNMIRMMLRCLRQATTLVLTAHAMSAEIQNRERMTKGQQAVLSGAAGDRSTLYEAVRVAIDGDFNPSHLFPAMLSNHATLELGRLLGRRGRGHRIDIGANLVRELRRQIDIRDAMDAAGLGEGETPTDEHAAALVITQTAYELVTRERWLSVLDQAVSTDSGVVLEPD